jgi:hypothetical protein
MVQEQVEQLVNAIGDIADNGVELQFIKTALREGNEIQNSISVSLNEIDNSLVELEEIRTAIDRVNTTNELIVMQLSRIADALETKNK